MDYNELAKDALQSAQTIKSISGRLEFYAAAITDLLARAEAAEDELMQKESYYNQMVDALSATDSFEKQKLCEEADHLKDLLKEAEARAEKAERERDEFKAKYIEAVNRACALSKIIDESGLEE